MRETSPSRRRSATARSAGRGGKGQTACALRRSSPSLGSLTTRRDHRVDLSVGHRVERRARVVLLLTARAHQVLAAFVVCRGVVVVHAETAPPRRPALRRSCLIHRASPRRKMPRSPPESRQSMWRRYPSDPSCVRLERVAVRTPTVDTGDPCSSGEDRWSDRMSLDFWYFSCWWGRVILTACTGTSASSAACLEQHLSRSSCQCDRPAPRRGGPPGVDRGVATPTRQPQERAGDHRERGRAHRLREVLRHDARRSPRHGVGDEERHLDARRSGPRDGRPDERRPDPFGAPARLRLDHDSGGGRGHPSAAAHDDRGRARLERPDGSVGDERCRTGWPRSSKR